MKIFSKKTTASLLAGAMLLTGAMSAGIVQAAESTDTTNRPERSQQQRPMQPPQMDNEKMAQELSDTFDISKDEVQSYQKENKGDFHDIFRAALLAKTSGRSFADVIALKTSSNTWKDVQSSLGITKEQIRTAQDELMAARMEKALSIPKSTSLSLMKQGYRHMDIAMASTLAKESGRTIDAVLAMRKINNTWEDVAKSLNISEDTLHKDMKGMHAMNGMQEGMPGGDMHRGGGQPPCPPPNDGRQPADSQQKDNDRPAPPAADEQPAE